MSESVTGNMRLPDGRSLSYSVTGSGENGSWIHCHGIPGSRLELAHLQNDLCSGGLRLIVPDRPGYGQSTPCPDYDFTTHADDLKQLAEHLRLNEFGLSGFSGGGIFATATALYLGARVTGLTITGTPAVSLMDHPFEHASELTAGAWQAALEDREALAVQLEAMTDSVDALAGALLEAVSENERHYLLSANVYEGFYTSLQSALAQGPKTAAHALARDTWLIAQPLPFTSTDLDVPIRILHGERDRLVHKQHQLALLRHLPQAQSRLIARTGHFDALAALIAEARC